MIGNPKYKYGDKVVFEYRGEKIVGEIYIIDAYGTFLDSNDVSYDIIVYEPTPYTNGRAVFKHITESLLSRYDET